MEIIVMLKSLGWLMVIGIFLAATLFLLFSHKSIKTQMQVINNTNHGNDTHETQNVSAGPEYSRYPMYFILGQSGSGKDTQAGKILARLQEERIPYLYVSIGDHVRLRRQSSSFFGKHMSAIDKEARLQPPTMPIHFFLTEFEEKYTGEEVIIINGSPRNSRELHLWVDYIQSGYFPGAKIINLEVTDDECRKRLMSRSGRTDTMDEKNRETKLGWYKPVREMLAETLPVGITLVTINGMQTEDQVFSEIEKFLEEEDVLMPQNIS